MPRGTKEEQALDFEARAYALQEWKKIPTPVTDEVMKEVGLTPSSLSGSPGTYANELENTNENNEKANKAYPLLWHKFKEIYPAMLEKFERGRYDRGHSVYMFNDFKQLEKEAKAGMPFIPSFMLGKMSLYKGMKKREQSDLLGLYNKPKEADKDLIQFPSREEELKGLFGGIKRRKTRASKKNKNKKRKTLRRRRV